ncbi:MAG: MjaI family restriction endonuclease [Fusobacteriaceae bacterium]|jgi:hypothetical protein|nr:MjaI family restriction endonuclease [Fusobacteriaceae bacterium]
MKYVIKQKDIQEFNESVSRDFPKYVSQLLNWANQNAQGTRPNVVGQLSELFPEFLHNTKKASQKNWEKWYIKKMPGAIDQATSKIYNQVLKLQEAIRLIDENMVRDWVKDLVFEKTFNGLYIQKAILAFLASQRSQEFRLSDPAEEARGIDGYVGDVPYSIKPDSYQSMARLPESIGIKMIYYKKMKTGIAIEVEE